MDKIGSESCIFCAVGFVFLFFFIEETNYRRPTITGTELKLQSGTESHITNMGARSGLANEKAAIDEPRTIEEGLGMTTYRKKTYFDKIKLFDSKVFSPAQSTRSNDGVTIDIPHISSHPLSGLFVRLESCLIQWPEWHSVPQSWWPAIQLRRKHGRPFFRFSSHRSHHWIDLCWPAW